MTWNTKEPVDAASNFFGALIQKIGREITRDEFIKAAEMGDLYTKLIHDDLCYLSAPENRDHLKKIILAATVRAMFQDGDPFKSRSYGQAPTGEMFDLTIIVSKEHQKIVIDPRIPEASN